VRSGSTFEPLGGVRPRLSATRSGLSPVSRLARFGPSRARDGSPSPSKEARRRFSTQSVQQGARAGYSILFGPLSVNDVNGPAAIALTPIFLVVALLWWETTSPVGLTFGKTRHDGKSLSAPTPTATDCVVATSQPAQDDAHQALIASGIFSRTSPEVVAAVSEQLHPERFSAGHVMGAQSDFGGCVYVIISGKVKVSYRRSGGGEIVLKILGPSEIFGAITLFDPGPRSPRCWRYRLPAISS
jgi:hypothetical protein